MSREVVVSSSMRACGVGTVLVFKCGARAVVRVSLQPSEPANNVARTLTFRLL